MSNDAKKTSQLGVATTLSANDRVVVLTSPASAAQTQTITVTNLTNSLRYANASVAGVVKVGNNLSINATGHLNAQAAGGLPTTGQENGFIVSWSNAVNSAIWSGFSAPYKFSEIDGTSSNTYTVTPDDYILFVDPGAFAQSINIVFPNDASVGKTYQVKNINPSDGYVVKVMVSGNTGILENPLTGELGNTFDIAQRGDSQEWVWDGTYYRHVGSQTNLPFYSADSNTFTQIVLQNRSAGNNASGDVVVYNNLGDPDAGTGPFIDMGINSSEYSNTTYSILGANGAYVFNDGGNFAIGTAGATSNLIFHAGGTTSSTAKVVINSTAVSVNTATAFILPLATKANNSPGVAGQISWDTNNIYVCVSTNTWKKVSISDFS